jgi:uncharacterized membrane protein YfcA
MSELTLLQMALIVGAGLAAGTINTIVGSGSLVTFPTLLALGYSPVVANVSNTMGLVPGSLSGTIGYRRELVGQKSRVIRLGVTAVLGGLTGGVLLLVLPAEAFEHIVPFLILVACGLMAIQPRMAAFVSSRRGNQREDGPLAVAAIFATGVYGGYFGAAQGVMLIALLATFITDDLQRLNGLKNVIVVLVNGVAALLFLLVAPVAWEAAMLVAIGSIIGGQVGAVVGRRMPPELLRVAIIIVGSAVAIQLMLT